MLAVGIGVPKGVMRRSPGPPGFTATKLITAAVAGPEGIPQPVGLPPCALKSVPVTRKLRVVPPAMGPPARRVSMMRQGATGVYTRSAWLSPKFKGPLPADAASSCADTVETTASIALSAHTIHVLLG